MPICDGFEACQRIRDHQKSKQNNLKYAFDSEIQKQFDSSETTQSIFAFTGNLDKATK